MPESDAYLEGIRMNTEERNVSNLQEITYEQIVNEVETIAMQLRALLPVTKDNWPEFNTRCAQLRGYAFNCFSLSSRMFMRSYFEQKPKPKQPSMAVSLEDLGL